MRIILIKNLMILMLIVTTFSACATIAAKKNDLEQAVSLYNLAVRWKKYDVALKYIEPSKRNDFFNLNSSKDLEILEYEVQNVQPDLKKGIAHVDVEFKWREKNSITVKDILIKQLWRLTGNSWYIYSQKETKKKTKKKVNPVKLF